MQGTLLFVHGTGVRDVHRALATIRRHAEVHLGLVPDQVQAVEWGRAAGPQRLDIGPALPPPPATRDVTGDASTESDAEVALWDLLAADPLLELRVLGESAQPDPPPGVAVGVDPPDVEARRRLLGLTVPPDRLSEARLSDDELAAAAALVGESAELAAAATAVGAWDSEDLVRAVSRATVGAILSASLLVTPRPGEANSPAVPAIALDSQARDALVAAVARAYAPNGTRGLLGDAAGRVLGPLAKRLGTRVAVNRRLQLMTPLSDFIRDVAWYIERGEAAREEIARAVRQARSRPVVVLAHSLGGIAAVDLLSDPAAAQDPDPVDVGLLVTVGSQAPLLYLLDALQTLSPRDTSRRPFLPWLNIYNRSDLLSFYAGTTFVNSPGIVDAEVDARVPFPESHSAYWDVPRLYEVLAERWPR